MKKIMNIIFSVVVVSSLCLLSACNTVAGFGKDMQKGGQSIQKVAKDS